jgi:hypothetical protein
MVVEYWGRRPSESQLSWIPGDYADRTVDYAARNTYDYAYEGTGNWPFNTAYAAEFGLHGHITRLHSLNELEDYLAWGIPVITSQSFLADELPNRVQARPVRNIWLHTKRYTADGTVASGTGGIAYIITP